MVVCDLSQEPVSLVSLWKIQCPANNRQRVLDESQGILLNSCVIPALLVSRQFVGYNLITLI